MERNELIVRIPLPMEILRQIDQLITDQVGGFRTRAEFFRHAAESMVYELLYEDAPPELQRSQEKAFSESSNVEKRDVTENDVSDTLQPTPGIENELTISKCLAGWSFKDGEGIAQIIDEPLFGLHNYDYPSLWIASQLANVTADGPIPLADAIDFLIKKGWVVGRALLELEKRYDRKLSYLFPTNSKKPQAAEDAFKAFAMGYVDTREEPHRARGPLFVWKVIQLQKKNDKFLVGLTNSGRTLIDAMVGLGPVGPHDNNHALSFIGYLQENAKPDWNFMSFILNSLKDKPNRSELLELVTSGEYSKKWTAAQVETNTAGYISRCREWGLVESKLFDRRYLLTQFGTSFI